MSLAINCINDYFHISYTQQMYVGSGVVGRWAPLAVFSRVGLTKTSPDISVLSFNELELIGRDEASVEPLSASDSSCLIFF